MEEYRRIEEQEKVMEVFGKNTIVSASAGSGKTRVLISKISDYLKNWNIDALNILALTYTNASAAEMKERLSQSLIKSIENEDLEQEKIQLLIQQIDKISTADISTFHSFYERTIKKYFYVIGIDPSFEILANEEEIILKDVAFKGAIENLKNRDFDGYLKMADVLGKKRKDNSIKDRIFKIDGFLTSQLDKEKWLNETALFMVRNKLEVYKILSDDILEQVEECVTAFEKLMREEDDPKLNAYINSCILELGKFKGLKFEQLFYTINTFAFPILPRNFDKKDKVYEIREEFKLVVKKYKNTFGDFENIENSFNSCERNIKTLLDLYKDFNNIFREKKKEINKYSFGDLEELCGEVLKDEIALEEIKEQYKLIFIDEFQDTNPIQYDIIKKISSGNNIFIVGDPKQSIYAFRQTDVEIFNNVYEEYLNEGTALSLKKNFRSNAKILNFINSVFDSVMTKNLSGVDYKNTSRFEPESKNSCEGNSVTISLVEKEKKPEKNISSVYDIFNDKPEKEDDFLEAQLVVHQIGKVIQEKIFDDKSGEVRKVNYGDITILIKDRSYLLKDLVREFRKYNIPYLVNDKIDLLASKEVQLVVALLKLTENIKNDLALAPVLASDFAGLTFNELALIRDKYKGKYFYDCFINYLENECDDVSKKLKEFRNIIMDFKFDLSFKGVGLAINLLLSKCKILQKIRLKENGDIRAEILQQFVSFIEQSPFNNDLAGLIQFIDNNKNIYVSSVKSNNLDAVNITTIHGSKGLEYPVVFLCGTGKDVFSGKPEGSDLKISKNFGVAIKNYDEGERKIYPSIFEEVIKIEKDKKDLAESFRLLYVALTRAKNKLFISGEFNESKIKFPANKENISKIKPKTFLNFIINSMDEDMLKKLQIDREFSNEDVYVSYINRDNFLLDFKQIKQEDDFDIQQIQKYISTETEVYKYKNATKLSQKTTVTQVMESNGYENVTYQPQKFIVSEHFKGITVEQGTIVHSILEKVDFSLEGQELENCIDEKINILNNGVIEVEYLKNLIKNNIKNIKKLIPNKCNIFKEKMFILNASLKDVFGEGEEEDILIQGKVDLIVVGEKNIIVDYKYTSIEDEHKLIDRYSKQLMIYRFAVESALSIKIDEIYIFDIKNSRYILVSL